jgi:hypothetical protein
MNETIEQMNKPGTHTADSATFASMELLTLISKLLSISSEVVCNKTFISAQRTAQYSRFVASQLASFSPHFSDLLLFTSLVTITTDFHIASLLQNSD